MKSFNLKAQYYLFFALAFFIPIHGKLIPITIALILLSWLSEFNFKEKYSRIKNSAHRKNILAFGMLYLLYVIGTFYSKVLYSGDGAFFDLEVKLSLLIFPLLFSTIDFNSFDKNFFTRVFDFFVLGSLFSGLLLIGFSFFDYLLYSKGSSAFFYTHLSHWHHPSYLALYFAFSIAILLNRLIHSTEIKKQRKRIYYWFILIFQLFIVLLCSKAGMLSLVLMYLLLIAYLILKKHRYKARKLLIPLILMVMLFITLLPFPQSYGRFITLKSSIEKADEIPAETRESSAERVLIWKSAIEVIKANLIFGVGTGDVKHALLKVYKANNIKGAFNDHLNAHNQYLQTTVALGLVGLLLLLLTFILPAIFAFKNNALLYLLFLILLTFNFLFESMLERQAGVVFYAFFNALLFYLAFVKEKVHPNL
jgi:O-antigen ligase